MGPISPTVYKLVMNIVGLDMGQARETSALVPKRYIPRLGGAYKRYVILKILASSPSGVCSYCEIVSMLRQLNVEIYSRQLLHYHIMSLVSMGLVRVISRSNHGNVYGITEKGRKALKTLRQIFDLHLDGSRYSPFSPYRLHYYCSSCGRWILKEKTHFNSNGQPICPFCHKTLRLGPKNKRKR